MVSVLGVGALILAAIIGTFILWRMNPEGVTRSVRLVDKVRWIAGLAFLGLAAWHMVRSGNPLLIAVSVGAVAFLTGYILVEQPWREVI